MLLLGLAQASMIDEHYELMVQQGNEGWLRYLTFALGVVVGASVESTGNL